jgi:hypothetical protein
MRDLKVEPQASVPRGMTPLRGKNSDGQDLGQVVTEPIKPHQTTYGTTSLVADSALDRAANLQHPGRREQIAQPCPRPRDRSARGAGLGIP